MRELADADRIRRLMRALGAAADSDVAAFFTGGATAVLNGWRRATIDVDIAFVPESDAILRAIPFVKNELQINVELVSPADFVPVRRDWQDRSVFVAREGRVSFYHFDPYAQAVAKLERAHVRDLEDVTSMLNAGLVDRERLAAYFADIEPALFRYPAIDPAALRARVEEATGRID
jgi:hypothetical protein